nr:class I tRNA ligase family protein [Candidatus Vampirococcus lugosii]
MYFFTTYANIDNYEGQFDEILNEISNSNFHKLNYNKLDKWIISELNQLIKEVDESMLNYDLQKSTNSISNFVQNLTNWYIRRSRRRFWKSENDDDKMQAYDTLYYVLIQFSKVLAPFCPFIAEKIYKILNDKESVHLENFPLFDEKLIDYDLNEEMNLVQNIISL